MANSDYTYSSSARRSPVRAIWNVISSRFVLIPALILSLVAAGVLIVYYQRYSQIIDAGLRGDLFVRSSGIYAAPLKLYAGTAMPMNRLTAHLRKIGYLDQGKSENEKRGQFTVRGATVSIYPGNDTLSERGNGFKNIRVTFDRNGVGIQSIVDLQTRQQLSEAEVEPELISSVINQDREKRKIIEYKDIPKNLLNAIITMEDRQFFDHPGVNWRGILRALVRDYQAGEWVEGGSSITQQLVKNLFIYKPQQTPPRTLTRKLQEAYMSIILEQRLSKEEIMAMYCNQIYLGQRGSFSINGFGQAARAYFGKDISTLTLDEAALLAGIINSPNYNSPYSNKARALDRRNKAIDGMVETGAITRAEGDAAKKRDVVVTGIKDGVDAMDAPYFVDYLMRQVENQFAYSGEPLNTLRIYSTIDLDLQRAAYQAVVNNMKAVDKLLARRKGGTAGLQAALVAMNPQTGEILAMVGGRDYAASQLNRAADSKRQPGSVFKPFVYATALSMEGDDLSGVITAASMFNDQPTTFQFEGKPYEPGNFGEKYEMKPVTLRDALVHSKNVVAVQVAERVGYSQVVQLVKKAGLNNIPPYPSMALGVGEATPLLMASAYTTFANQGKRVAPLSIKRVINKDGGTVFESTTETREVISPQVAYIMTTMMKDVIDRGTGTRVRQMGLTAPAAGKTGSSRDGWFAGYTPNLVCVVWVGFDDNSNIVLTGGATAAPIWADFMIKALQVRPELGGDFKMPEEGLVTFDIDPTTGTVPETGALSVRHELFLNGTEPGTQPPHDPSNPDAAKPPATGETDVNNPPTAPKPSGVEPKVSGSSNDQFIPLPPEARRRMSKENPTPTPELKKEEKKNDDRSFFRRIIDSLGISSTEPKPEASDTQSVQPAVQKQADVVRPTATPAPPASGKQTTFSIEVCSVTGLLPVDNLCKSRERRRFTLGNEPKASCNAERHRRP
ncbi:MAG: PBP1A family penicillin-binding protein [Acidobacteria bacterium]|nr:PBP1A family penicillin-binding protein [Acidobacteriota bacterium]